VLCGFARGLCHTDLEVIDGSLRYPMPIVLGHEAAGVVEQVGPAARGVKTGDHVVLSWNPHLRALLLLRPRFADPVEEYSARAEGTPRSMAKAAPCWPMAAICNS